MKILHVINSLGLGGAERLITELAPIFNLNYQCDVLILRETNSIGVYEKTFVNHLKSKGVIVHSLTKNSLYSPRILFSLKKTIAKYNVVHSHLFPTQYWVVFASKLIKKKKRPILITTEHNTYNRRRTIPFFLHIDKWIYNNYNCVISISEKTEEALFSYIKSPRYKSYIVLNGVNLSSFSSAKLDKCFFEKKTVEKEFVLIQVAGFRDQKDQDTLIKALSFLPKSVVAVFAGSGKRLDDCKALAQQLQVDNRCYFLGAVNNVSSLLKTSDIVVVSSHWEGFGLAAVEGMAAGKPVVASDVPGLSEVVKDAGILFEKSNSEHLSHSILSLFEDKEYYSLVARKCFERSQKYSIEKMAEQYIYIYKNIYNEGNKNI